ncbi:MAG: hypothetical protein ACI9F9_002709 [Candidatus Paceibacteria bacterium]|jgi:hypothetical protein
MFLRFVLALAAVLAPFTGALHAGDEVYRDSITLKNGKVIEGRILERNNPEQLVLYQKTRSKEYDHEDIASIHTVRDDLDKFMTGHSPNLTVEEEWRRVQEAMGLGLDSMARVQAWKVLTLDPQHGGANEHLGHKRIAGEYRWVWRKKQQKPKDFAEQIQEWSKRFVLESEHYVVETNTTVGQAVNIIHDLELVYLYWMQEFGEELWTGEDVYDKNHKMTFWVYQDKSDKGYKLYYNSKREPFYNPSTVTSTDRSNPNLAISYYKEGTGERPVDFFNVAIQQLMYSTLVLSRKRGYIPITEYTIPAHWAELGMGFWLGRQFGGPAGYARHQRFVVDSRNRELASRRILRGPLSNGLKRREVTNLIGLERRYYYVTSQDNVNELYRAKARSFFRFLVEADPEVISNRRVVGYGRAGVMGYLRDVYIMPTSHSSKSFDKALGGKVELLYDGWVKWRQ